MGRGGGKALGSKGVPEWVRRQKGECDGSLYCGFCIRHVSRLRTG